MSYIDTFKHELVGYLNGLQIYHPLETIEGRPWGDYDFSCSPGNLVLGGGAGEHPGLVIHNLGSLAASFALNVINSSVELGHYPALPQASMARLLARCNVRACPSLEFCGWSKAQITRFTKLAKSEVNCSPLSAGEDLQAWVEKSIGEFVYFSLPELNPFHDEIKNLEGFGWEPSPWYQNITCPPPNYVLTKKKALARAYSRNGFFRWDYKYPPEE